MAQGVASGFSRATASGRALFNMASGHGTASAVGVANVSPQSYSHLIRNAFFDVLDRDPFFAKYTRRKNKMLSAQHELLPYLGVYLIDEPMIPDGDSNAGNIRFIHTPRIGFSIMIVSNDQDECETQLDAIFRHLELQLWGDPYINNVQQTYNPHIGRGNPDNVRFEGIDRGMRRYVWGNAANNNQTPIGELQYDVTVRFRSYEQPGPFDDLDQIVLDTGVKPGDSQLEMDARPQVHRVYRFDNASFAAKRAFRKGR